MRAVVRFASLFLVLATTFAVVVFAQWIAGRDARASAGAGVMRPPEPRVLPADVAALQPGDLLVERPLVPVAATGPGTRDDAADRLRFGIDCRPGVGVTPRGAKWLEVAIAASCYPGAILAVRTGPLEVPVRTGPDGAARVLLPALAGAGTIDVRAPAEDVVTVPSPGGSVTSLIALSSVSGQAQLHLLAPGAAYGGPGHIQADATGNLGMVRMGAPGTRLVDAFPDPSPDMAASVEVPVTAANCGRDIEAKLLRYADGQSRVHALSLSVPDCDAIGEFLVLKMPPLPRIIARN